MRIALVKVPDTDKDFMLNAVQYPVNVAYLAAICIEQGHEVELWDFCVEAFDKEYIEQKINKFKPQVMGLSCVTAAISNGHRLAKIAKSIDENIFVIIGGVHISVLPEETMNSYPEFDLGVLTEGEIILPKVLNALEAGHNPSGIAGTVYRENNKLNKLDIAQYPDVNKIPFPARDLVPHHLYDNRHAARGISRNVWNVLEMDTSRGCPFDCSFCNVKLTHGRIVRFRNPDNVIQEIEICKKKYNSNFILFNDSTFTFSKSRVKEMVRQLPKRGIKGYYINGHTRTVDFELCKLLAKTGCKKISFGIESGSQKVLNKIRKKTSISDIKHAVDVAKKSGIPIVEGCFILGADIDEDEADFKETENLIRELNLDIVALSIITPFPGSEQFEQMRNLGHLDNVRWEDFQIFAQTPPPWRINNFSAEELAYRRNRILRSYYWNYSYILNRLIRIRSIKELIYYYKMAQAFFQVVVRKNS